MKSHDLQDYKDYTLDTKQELLNTQDTYFFSSGADSTVQEPEFIVTNKVLEIYEA